MEARNTHTDVISSPLDFVSYEFHHSCKNTDEIPNSARVTASAAGGKWKLEAAINSVSLVKPSVFPLGEPHPWNHFKHQVISFPEKPQQF